MTAFSRNGLAPHLEVLVPSEWGIWRWFVLRGAGFPAELLTRLVQPHCAAFADRLIAAENQVQDLFQIAIRSLNGSLDQLRRQGENRYGQSFTTLLNARRRLAAGKVPGSGEFSEEMRRMFIEITEALRERARLHAEWTTVFEDALVSQGATLRRFARDPKFQEAVVWQNRRAFETAVQSVAGERPESTRNQRQRNHEELVANYAQRYCMKNDTIGFFGPVGWARIEPNGQVFELSPGPALIKGRQTYFENWAVDKLAASLSSLPGMDWWIPPCLAPDVFIEKGKLHRAGSPPEPLSEFEQAVLPLCDGKTLPEEILCAIRSNPRLGAFGQVELRSILEARVAEGTVAWRFLLPVEVNSEIGLRQQLLRVGDSELRAIAVSQLEKLEAGRHAVDVADGPIQLSNALRNVELVFEEITKVPGHRNPGTTYGGRTLLYEDCQRDLTFRITPGLLKPIIPALSLLLQSLRWLMRSTTLEFNRLFVQSYRELVVHESGRELPLMDWWLYTEPKLMNASSLGQIDELFRQKWAEVLPLGDEPVVQFDSCNLKERVEQLFPELDQGHHPVLYFCPDLMLAATDADAIRRGDVLYVLGEMHSGKNSLCHAALVEQHPNRDDLAAALQWDLPTARFKIVAPQQAETTTVRTTEGLLLPGDYLLATTPDAPPTGCDGHPMSELTIREQNDELRVVSRADGGCFHILEAFADLLYVYVTNKASWIRRSRHVPRVLLDKLVIQRETWRFRKEELAFAMEKDESHRFLGARRWMRRCGVARETFVKSVSEAKPFYLNLESPILVEILCRAIRRMNDLGGDSDQLTFTEMLPGTTQLWLEDAEGARYTSELRFAVVDLRARASSASK